MADLVGEDVWLSYLEEAQRNATDTKQSDKFIGLIELYKCAVFEEPGSLRLWSAYCEYFWLLYEMRIKNELEWSKEEKAIGKDEFSLEAALKLWEQGYEAIRYRISDSHLFWDRWISIEKDQLPSTQRPEAMQKILERYRERLNTPHMTWNETSQSLSSFLSKNDQSVWESFMKEVTSTAQNAKNIIAARDPFETKISQAEKHGDQEQQRQIMRDYLEWETNQSWKDSQLAVDICCGLHDRALSSLFAFDEAVWYGYISFLSARPSLHSLEKLLETIRRAVRHCPFSGRLWARYVLCAEESKLTVEQVEKIKNDAIARIKEAAMADNQLSGSEMDNMLEVCHAWCGFLKRTAMKAICDNDCVDLADVGIKLCIEEVQAFGKKLHGSSFRGDPKLRLERIYVQFLSEIKHAVPQARSLWKKLMKVDLYADTYNFWIWFYNWEMSVFWSELQRNRRTLSVPSYCIPSLATEVLRKASRRNVDWPEKILELYLQHCNNYESAETLRKALDSTFRAEKGVKKRREREAQEQAAAYAAYYSTANSDAIQAGVDGSPKGNKRKHEPSKAGSDLSQASIKRHKSEQDDEDTHATTSQVAKRDRENSTIIISNLPPDATQSKVRQYFKDCGHIKSFSAFVKDDVSNSVTALAELNSPSEVEYALFRDQKFFGEHQIQVRSGQDLTVYVTNYPPEADEDYIRKLFQDCGPILSIRWPSLKVNAHRRFCYVSFRHQEAAKKAVEKNGIMLQGKYKLLSKLSDPSHKKEREGAVAEGREIHVSNLDKSILESDIRDIFSKYGNVTRVNIPRGMNGKSRGFCFLDFETKEQAEIAVSELNNTKFRNQILQVSSSKISKIKTTAKSFTVRALDAEEGSSIKNDTETRNLSAFEDISARTIALLGLPDTINDARVQKLAEPFGSIVRLVLKPMHGGAIIEFADAATAGKAVLQLNGMQYEGYKLRTGSPEELKNAKAKHGDNRPAEKFDSKYVAREDHMHGRPTASGGFMPAPSRIRRTASRPGPKRRFGFAPRMAAAAGNVVAPSSSDETSGSGQKKTNADFKAMFLSSSNKDGKL